MKTRVLKSIVMAVVLAGCWSAQAQTPTIAPSAVNFSYQMGATPLIQQLKVVATLPAANASQVLTVNNVVVAMYQMSYNGANICSLGPSNTGCGWLSVSPTTGKSPLTLTVTANPSTLTAGSYTGFFTVTTTTAPFNPVIVNVTLSISNPPSKLAITSPWFPTDASGNQINSLGFSFTTSDLSPTPPSEVINVSSTGDIIPFTVTVANVTAKGSGGGATTPVWLRVTASGGNGLAATAASSSAFPGSFVGITVTLDYNAISTLDPAGSPYSGTITIAAAQTVNGSFTVPVTLNIAAGAPSITSIFPTAVNAVLAGTTPTGNFIFTLVGDNFFTTTAVSLQQGTPDAPVGAVISLPQPAYLSRQLLQVTVNQAYFTVPQSGGLPVEWFLKIANPAPATNPSLPAVTAPFVSLDPTQPSISGVVNAASYQQASVWAGGGTDPIVSAGGSPAAVSPREIISIFGQNLGPSTASTAQPLSSSCPGVTDGTTNCLTYATTWGDITVIFSYTDANGNTVSRAAPILMTSMNQINAIVPKEVAELLSLPSQQASISVINGGSTTAIPFAVTVVAENPGMFTFGGLGQGQGAIINYDATGTVTSVNSTKNAEPRGDTIAIYLTGLGILSDDSPLTGDVIPISSAPNVVADSRTVRVEIGGQPCVVTYAGAAYLAVAGLVQINAVVTPSAKVGTNVPIVVSIGPLGSARSSQSGVTLAVK